MIKVRKGTQVAEIPTGAYKSFYKAAGWAILKEEKPETPLEKEIKSMTNAELKEYAQSKGIKTAGVSKKSLIEALTK